jgi:hypothetical protein
MVLSSKFEGSTMLLATQLQREKRQETKSGRTRREDMRGIYLVRQDEDAALDELGEV